MNERSANDWGKVNGCLGIIFEVVNGIALGLGVIMLVYLLLFH
jgi:hypothetical protein